MGFCRAAVISPLNGDAMVVEVAGGGVAALGEVPAGMTAAEAAKKFRVGGPLPRGIHSSYFHHWRPMNESPLLRDGVFVELTAVGDTDNGVNCDATWSRVCLLTWSPRGGGRLPNVRTIKSPSSCPPPLDT
jgi:hypothetical protein